MSTLVAPTRSAPAGGEARKHTRGLRFCLWSMPFFYALFGVVFVLLTRLMPPPSPHRSTAQIVDFVSSHRTGLQVGIVLLMASIGLSVLTNALVAVTIKRMEGVGNWLAYGYLGALGVGVLPGCLICGFSFALAAFRPERSPETITMLYDLGLLSFVGSLGCFIVQYLMFALAVLFDRGRVIPGWLGYVTVWALVAELVAAPAWIYDVGPFAWNGLLAFYQGTVLWVVWQVCLWFSLRKSIA